MKHCQATSCSLDLLCWCATSLLFGVPQCKKSKPQTNTRTKWSTWKYTTSLPQAPLILDGTLRVPAFVYKKSCGSQLFWDALDVACTENSFDNWNLLKWKTTETWDSSSMELPLIFFSQGGKGSAWLWSYYLPSTWFSVHVPAVSCLETWLSFLVFLKYFPFEKICRWR